MESKKNVIQIIKKASNQFEYNEIYYFTDISCYNGRTNIRTTGDIWSATKFENMTPNDAEAWCKFIKSILGKHYEINIKTISLNYEY